MNVSGVSVPVPKQKGIITQVCESSMADDPVNQTEFHRQLINVVLIKSLPSYCSLNVVQRASAQCAAANLERNGSWQGRGRRERERDKRQCGVRVLGDGRRLPPLELGYI